MKKLMATALTLMMLAGTFAPTALSAEGSGWKKDGDDWYYVDDSGKNKTGWLATGSGWYYMDADGIMQTGWREIDGKKYYFEPQGDHTGKMATGETKIDGIYYGFDASGALTGRSGKSVPLYSGYKKLDDMVKEILAEVIKPGMSQREELKAIHDWVCSNISYAYIGFTAMNGYKHDMGEHDGMTEVIADRRKPHIDYHHAYDALIERRGVCDDYVDLFCVLADALGYRTASTGGKFDGGGHKTAMVWFDGGWKFIDPQLDDYKDNGSIEYLGFLVDPKDEAAYYNQHYEPAFEIYFDYSNIDNDEIQNTKYYFNDYKKYGWGKTVEEIVEYFADSNGCSCNKNR